MDRTGRLVLIAVALMSLAFAGGCFFLDARFSMAPDASVDARIETGVLKSMAGDGEVDAELSEGLAEGKWTEQEQYERDQWLVTAMVGHAGPGESLFRPDAEPQPQFEMTRHALSNAYTFRMPLPESGDAGLDGEAVPEGQAGDGGEAEVEGMEAFGDALGEMIGAVFASGDSGLRFSVELPGEIVETNGKMAQWRGVEWTLDPMAPEPGYEELFARSRLLNWAQVGRLAEALADRGRWDLAPALISGVQRGIVPDPVTDDPAAVEFDALMYVQALEIMVALDRAVGERISTEVIKRLGLSDDPDPALVEEIAVRLEGMDIGAEIDREVVERLLGMLGGG